MTRLRLHIFIAMLAAMLGSGCVSLGRAPTDFDLHNSGDPQQQAALHKRYAVSYDEFEIRRPGATPEHIKEETGDNVGRVAAPAASDEAYEYLSSSKPAAQAIDTSAVGFDRFASSSSMYLLVQMAPIAVGAGVGAAAGLGADGTALEKTENAMYGAAFGALGGVFLSVPLTFLYTLVVPAITHVIAAPDYRKGVTAFNQDLEQRIRAAGENEAPKAAPPAVAPQAPAAPPSIPPAAAPAPIAEEDAPPEADAAE